MLKQDSCFRGKNAVHVSPHGKLGKHRTIIRGALPLVNLLVSDNRVAQVSLGLMRSLWPRQKKSWLSCEPVEGKNSLKLVVMDGQAVQFLKVKAINRSVLAELVALINSHKPPEPR